MLKLILQLLSRLLETVERLDPLRIALLFLGIAMLGALGVLGIMAWKIGL